MQIVKLVCQRQRRQHARNVYTGNTFGGVKKLKPYLKWNVTIKCQFPVSHS